MTSNLMSQPMSILTSHQSQDWYTPPKYIELVREVLGTIELDPASDELPQEWIQAKNYWTKGSPEKRWNDSLIYNPFKGEIRCQNHKVSQSESELNLKQEDLEDALNALLSNLFRRIVLLGMLKCDLGLTHGAEIAIENELGLLKPRDAEIQLRGLNFLRRRQDIANLIEERNPKEFSPELITSDDKKELIKYLSIGLEMIGNDANYIGVTDVLTVENMPFSPKTISFLFLIQTLLERFQETWFQRVDLATMPRAANPHMIGAKM